MISVQKKPSPNVLPTGLPFLNYTVNLRVAMNGLWDYTHSFSRAESAVVFNWLKEKKHNLEAGSFFIT